MALILFFVSSIQRASLSRENVMGTESNDHSFAQDSAYDIFLPRSSVKYHSPIHDKQSTKLSFGRAGT